MSIAVMTKCWKDAPVAGTELLMLLALADICDEEMECYPSIKHLASKCRCSERQANRLLKSLERQFVIEIKDQAALGRGKVRPGKVPNLYIITPTNWPTDDAHDTPTDDAHDTPTDDAHDTPTDDAHDTLNHHIESSLESFAPRAKAQGAKKTIPSHIMNPMKDAIATVFQYEWHTMTKTETGCVQKAAKELIEAGVTPEQIPPLYEYCAAHFDNFKAMALPNNLSEWRKVLPILAQPTPATFDLSKWTSDPYNYSESEG